MRTAAFFVVVGLLAGPGAHAQLDATVATGQPFRNFGFAASNLTLQFRPASSLAALSGGALVPDVAGRC